ncbi:HalOD1 output domain-containing protein [Haloarcula salina]|uniref:Halobacterial output domain-containing protein n=1 Tax=Haloarcula salina TaxID=1429914 RepID=A0AA41G3E1_9EURY|nr:HalOD1 output domain-containing protein [Haloarcula salina]MBV0903435.1 hypothetical protein [Haloarcula salina]
MEDLPESEIVRTSVPGPNGSVVDVIVEAVAELQGRSALDLPPLTETVDGDALDSLFPADSVEVTVSFTFDGTDVVVQSPATVHVSLADD